MSADPEPRQTRNRRAAAAAAAAETDPEPPPPPPPPHNRKAPTKQALSEEDEILLLQSFLEITTDSPSPLIAASALFERVAKSLTVTITNSQLIEKLRDLRTTYSKQTLDKGFAIDSLSPHQRSVFELSRKIWGGEDAQVTSNGVTGGDSRTAKRRKKQGRVRVRVSEETLIGDEELRRGFPFLMEEMDRLKSSEGVMRGLRLLGRSELERLDKSWRDQQIREAKLVLKKEELVMEAKGFILEALGRN